MASPTRTVHVSTDLVLSEGQYRGLKKLMERYNVSQDFLIQRMFNIGLVIVYEHAKITQQARASAVSTDRAP